MLHLLRRKLITACLWTGLIGAFAAGQAGWAGFIPAATQTGGVSEGLPDEITVEQAKTKRDTGAFFLDVREPSEWNQAHIPDAALIPLGLLEKRSRELPQDKEIIVVCGSGGRSATGRDILRKAGYRQVTSMSGGMKAWRAAGYPIVTGP